MNRPIITQLLITLFVVFTSYTHSLATWSIIAVDRTTGEVGIAGASCTWDVRGIGIHVPGKGVVVVQAESNSEPRELGAEMLLQGALPIEIMNAMRNETFRPESQQYGVISLAENTAPIIYSGKYISVWHGGKVGDDFAVIGNTLPGDSVLTRAFEAFENAQDKSLSERLMLALEAGAAAGGDKRCGEQRARSAFITVSKPDDNEYITYLNLGVHELDFGKTNAVKVLSEIFENWKINYSKQRGTVFSIVPKE